MPFGVSTHAPSGPALAYPNHPYHELVVLSYLLQRPIAKHKQPK
jgi:hypothetical protein